MNSALETLVAQAYGAINFKKAGQFLNQGRFVISMTLFLIAGILSQAERILLFAG